MQSSVSLLNKMPKKLTVFHVAEKHGQPKGGPDLAPAALKDSGMFNCVQNLGYQVNHVNIDCGIGENTKSLGEVCRDLHNKAAEEIASGSVVLTLGGDHGIATGSIGGVLKANPDTRVIWVDAHGDINTPDSSPSKNYHGMPVAHLMGLFRRYENFEWFNAGCLPTSNLVFIGLRDLDEPEKKFISDNDIKAFSMTDIEEHGIGTIMKLALDHLNPDNSKHPLHISFDIDACDPLIAPGTGTRSRGGLSYRESHYIMRKVSNTGLLRSVDMVEINPVLDAPGKRETLHGDELLMLEGSETVLLGAELILSSLGHKLL